MLLDVLHESMGGGRAGGGLSSGLLLETMFCAKVGGGGDVLPNLRLLSVFWIL